jgi:hypothetical protein
LPAASSPARDADDATAEHFGAPAAGATTLAPASPDCTASFTTGFGTLLAEIGSTVGRLPRALLRDTDPGDRPDLFRQFSVSEMAVPAGGPERYQLFGEIARGGMGAVIRGRDLELGRELALKVLLESHQGNPDLISRFVEEAQIGGQLRHPGVVPVYDVDTLADRRPFFMMKSGTRRRR